MKEVPVRETVVHGRNGLLVDRDQLALASAIDRNRFDAWPPELRT